MVPERNWGASSPQMWGLLAVVLIVAMYNQRAEETMKKKEEPKPKSTFTIPYLAGSSEIQVPSSSSSTQPDGKAVETAPTAQGNMAEAPVAQQLERLEVQLLRLRRAEQGLRQQINAPTRETEMGHIKQKLKDIEKGKHSIKQRVRELRASTSE